MKPIIEAIQVERAAWIVHNAAPTAATAEVLQAATVAKWAAIAGTASTKETK